MECNGDNVQLWMKYIYAERLREAGFYVHATNTVSGNEKLTQEYTVSWDKEPTYFSRS